VQYLKLAKQVNEKGNRVLVDFQNDKFEAEVFDDAWISFVEVFPYV
jgi:hypothetical protein